MRSRRPTIYHLRLPLLFAACCILLATTLLAALIRSPAPLAFHHSLFDASTYTATIPGINMTTSLSASKDNVQVTVGREDSALTFTIPLTNSQITGSGENVSYVAPRNGLKLDYQLTPRGLKESIILGAAPAPSTTSLPLTISLKNLVAKLTPEGIPVFFDGSGHYQFNFEAPYAVDGKGVVSRAFSYHLVPASGPPLPLDQLFNQHTGTSTKKSLLSSALPLTANSSLLTATTYTLELALDSQWLAAKDRVYPVTIDPTVVHNTSSTFASGTFNRTTDIGSVTGFTGGGSATGGTITTSGGYTIHTFTTGGTFTAPGNGNVEVLVVGAGGAGSGTSYIGGAGGGGGGGGQVLYNSFLAVTSTPITVTVGTGGSGNGGSSIFSSITAAGGVGGTDNAGAGGASGAGPAGGAGAGSAPTCGAANRSGGGGGGVASTGTAAVAPNGGAGGTGTAYSISGTLTYYGGGGGGGSEVGTQGSGGLGGGGAGGHGSGAPAGTAGTANTGGGGGGGGGLCGVQSDATSNGGSGVVIVRYPTTYSTLPNLTDNYQELPDDQYTVGLWHMNEASGNLTDSSGNGNTGTPTGTTVVAGQSGMGNARQFNGSSDYISIADNPILHSPLMTVEAWIYPTVFIGSASIYNMRTSGNVGGTTVEFNSTGTINCDFYISGAWRVATTPTSLILNSWNHVACTYDGSMVNAYLNGQLTAETAITGTINNPTSPSILIGKNITGAYYFNGSIDEVRISSIARSPEEVRLDASRRPYSAYTSPLIDLTKVYSWNSLSWTASGVGTGDGETLSNATGLVAEWNFNETSGTTANVAAGSCGTSCNGTLTNFTNTTSQDVLAGSGWTATNARWPATSPGAIVADGINDYVDAGTNTSLKPANVTLATWIKTNYTGANGYFVNKMSANTGGHVGYGFVMFTAGKMRATVTTNTSPWANIYVESPFPTNDGQWHYYALTYDTDNILRLYIDGKFVNSSSGGTGVVYEANGNFYFGAENNGGTIDGFTPGIFDSTTVYSRALTAGEILSNYNSSNLELQTRVGNSSVPDDGSWEAWKPTTSETQIDSFDTIDRWSVDSFQNSQSTLATTGTINSSTAFGTGSDGNCVVDNGTITLDSTAGSSACAGSARSTAYAVNFTDTNKESLGQTSVTVSSTPTGLVAGDEFVIIDMQGTSTSYNSVGLYETHVISSVATNTLNFTDYPLKNLYDGTTHKIVVQRVPNFGSVTVCGGNTGGGCTAAATLTPSAWNGTKGGVLFFRSNGTVTVNSGGTITSTATGYRNGQFSTDATCATNVATQNGESYTGPSFISASNNGGGSGGIAANGTNFSGTLFVQSSAGAVQTGQTGQTGSSRTPGTLGATYGNGNTTLLMGSGGGGGMTCGSGGAAVLNGTNTSSAGGAIYISGSTINISGSITSSSSNQIGQGHFIGGASGGAVNLVGNTLSLGTNLITSVGGLATNPNTSYTTQGGAGHINISYVTSVSGTTSPDPYLQQFSVQTPKLEGTNSLRLQTGQLQADSATVGLWHLDETGGNGAYIKDVSGNGNNGTPTGTTVVDGVIGKAKNFNGSGDTIAVNNPASFNFERTSNFSIESWIKTTGANEDIFTKMANVAPFTGYDFFLNGGKLSFYLINTWNTNTLFVQTTTLVNDGNWHHVAVTYTGNSAPSGINLYIDGISQGLTTVYNTLSATILNNVTPYIGSRNSFAGNGFFSGTIDEVRVSSTSRSVEEISEDYRMGRDHRLGKTIAGLDLSGKQKLAFQVAADRPGTYLEAMLGNSAYANYEPDGNTVGFWHMDEQNGSYYRDSSGYGNNSNGGSGMTYVQGKIGKARSFNGTSDYMSLTDNAGLGSTVMTVDGWVYPRAFTGSAPIYNRRTAGNVGGVTMQFNGTSGSVACYFYIGGSWQVALTTNLLSLNQWSHLACTYDGSTIRSYVNGVADTTTAVSGTINNPASPLVRIGLDQAGTNYVNGIIDEVRVSNIARSAGDIRAAYEFGKRTHEITIDFAAALAGSIGSSSTLSFPVDGTGYGLLNKGSNLYPGDKLIVRENYGGTDYIAQGTVTSVNVSTGAVTVSGWDSGSTFPTIGFDSYAVVFKWQREYMDLSCILPSQRSAVTRLTLRLTNGNEGRTIWLDDLESTGGYLSTPGGSTITSSTGYRYFQYRAILSSSDYNVSPSLTSVTVDYVGNSAPSTPTLDSPTNGATGQPLSAVLKTTATDPNSDTIKYKIVLCTNSAMNAGCQTFDQTTSAIGWSAASYASGVQGVYTLTTPLAFNTTYYWDSYAIDPAGSNTWSSTQGTPYSFTTMSANPTSPTLLMTDGSLGPVTNLNDPAPYFSAIHNDPGGVSASIYQLQVNTTPDFTGSVMWDSGATSMTTTASGARSPNITYAGSTLAIDGTRYYWRLRFTNTNSLVGAWSTVGNFSTMENALGCTVAENNTLSTMTVQWGNHATSNTGYEIRRAVDGGSFSTLVTGLAAGATSYADSTVTTGHTYQYEIAPYYAGPTYGPWCQTSTLSLQIGIFRLD